jgi:hypothetical protein
MINVLHLIAPPSLPSFSVPVSNAQCTLASNPHMKALIEDDYPCALLQIRCRKISNAYHMPYIKGETMLVIMFLSKT